jgi:hypothetical protein
MDNILQPLYTGPVMTQSYLQTVEMEKKRGKLVKEVKY